jgi:beta-N-acetylhexosaminidase
MPSGGRFAPTDGATASKGRPSVRTLGRDLGQMIIATFAGAQPTPAILQSIRAGQVGGVILFGDNTAKGVAATRTLAEKLQSAARAGGNVPLLIVTDEEGGAVQRLGAPFPSASAMASTNDASHYGVTAGKILKAAGVNVDLAPVADVARVDGFMQMEQRTFGSTPGVVAAEACAFARGLAEEHVGYTLKHFPGLGSAIQSTDNGPVTVGENATELNADEAAYKQCASSSPGIGLVMVSNASYRALGSTLPAVLNPQIYNSVLPDVVKFHGVTISDDLQAGALTHVQSPARTAIDAGLDLLLYAGTESASEYAYTKLLAEAANGSVNVGRITEAYTKIMELKRSLGLGGSTSSR